ncbi:MAG: hypothetical protein ABIH87_04550 [bacterium]
MSDDTLDNNQNQDMEYEKFWHSTEPLHGVGGDDRDEGRTSLASTIPEGLKVNPSEIENRGKVLYDSMNDITLIPSPEEVPTVDVRDETDRPGIIGTADGMMNRDEIQNEDTIVA